MKKTIKQLKAKSVRKLLSNPKRWCKKVLISDDGMSCCLMGAIDKVYSKSRERIEAVHRLFNTLNQRRKKQKKAPLKDGSFILKEMNIVDWNDANRTTFQAVQEVVKQAKI